MKDVVGFKCEYADYLQTWVWTHMKHAILKWIRVKRITEEDLVEGLEVSFDLQ